MSLWFIVPAHGRVGLTRVCLRQLRRTCDALTADGIEASAVVIATDENLQTAGELGFATVARDNEATSRRFNDGIQLACDPAYNPRPARYVVPCGSDDWVDHRILRQLPTSRRTVVAFRELAFVREDGEELTFARVGYRGGCGIRIYPAELMALADYRPADEDRSRGCDTSILLNLSSLEPGIRVDHRDLHEAQIVDWKSVGANLNPYSALAIWGTRSVPDPWSELEGIYPEEALEEMRSVYARRLELVS